MSIKTKENEINKKQNRKLNLVIILVIILLVLIIMTIFISNRTMVLDKVGKLLNANETNKTGEIQTVSIENWDLEKVNIVYDKDNIAVPVPKGYVASRVENGVTPLGQEIVEENRVNTGFVIYEMTAEEIKNGIEVSITRDNFWEESQKRNQWVWVPVLDPSRIYERDASTGKAKSKLWEFTTTGRTKFYGQEPGIVQNYDNEKNFAKYDMQGMTKSKLLEELENEFEATVESIEKYGGFYIGRYETGDVGSGSSSNHNTLRQPVVQRMNTNLRYVIWYDAYNNMKNIQRNENVKSNIIWGCLWDEILQWLVDSGSKNYEEIKNPVAWGNYKDSEFDYINETGTKVHKNANSIVTVVPAGSSESNKANNIYDIAGNMTEWTLEVHGYQCRKLRGSDSYDVAMSNSVDYRDYENPEKSCHYFGVRAYFYIK